jgi:hypothetical protein
MTRRKPGARRGRHNKRFFSDPQRYLLALALALQGANFRMSQRQSFNVVAVMLLGRKTGEAWRKARPKPGVGLVGGGIVASYERIWGLRRESSAHFASFSNALRKKMRSIDDPKARNWLDVMARGMGDFLTRGWAEGYDLENLLRYVLACADHDLKEGGSPSNFLNMLMLSVPIFDPSNLPA